MPYIGNNENWFISGVDTGFKSKGEDGLSSLSYIVATCDEHVIAKYYDENMRIGDMVVDNGEVEEGRRGNMYRIINIIENPDLSKYNAQYPPSNPAVIIDKNRVCNLKGDTINGKYIFIYKLNSYSFGYQRTIVENINVRRLYDSEKQFLYETYGVNWEYVNLDNKVQEGLKGNLYSNGVDYIDEISDIKYIDLSIGGTVFNCNSVIIPEGNYSAHEFTYKYLSGVEGTNAFAEGDATLAKGNSSHTEGEWNTASGDYSHTEGEYTAAQGQSSHAEGEDTLAMGDASHAEGSRTLAVGDYSHAEGFDTVAQNAYEHSQGTYNVSNKETDTFGDKNTIFSIGVGTNGLDRKNAIEVLQNGDVYINGIGDYDGTNALRESYLTGKIAKPLQEATSSANAIGYIYNSESGAFIEGENHEWLNSAPAPYKVYKLNEEEKEALGFYSGSIGISYDYCIDCPDNAIYSIIYNEDKVNFKNSKIKDCSGIIGVDGNIIIQTPSTGILNNNINLKFFNLDLYDENGEQIILDNTEYYFTYPNAGKAAHIEGSGSIGIGDYSHAEGLRCSSYGIASHAEGCGTSADGDYSHAEGSGSIGIGDYSHAEGGDTSAAGDYSHAEGSGSIGIGDYSHAEGLRCSSYGIASHAEGGGTSADGDYSHAEGFGSYTNGNSSHAEGEGSCANGESAHAEGCRSIASGDYSHTEGLETETLNRNEHAEGVLNLSNKNSDEYGDPLNTLHSIGNGYTKRVGSNYIPFRRNAFEVMQNGDTFIYGVGDYDGTNITSTNINGERLPASIQEVLPKYNKEKRSVCFQYNEADNSLNEAQADYSFVIGYNNKAIREETDGAGLTLQSANSFVGGMNNRAYHSNSIVFGEGLFTQFGNTFVLGKYNNTVPNHDGWGDTVLGVVGDGYKDAEGNITRRNVILIQGGNDPAIHCRGGFKNNASWINDFGEYFEWLDGNPDNEDRIGYMVQLNGDKIELATSLKKCIGVISGTTGFIGGVCAFEWHNKFLHDKWGREIIGEDGNPVINPDYDPELKYIPREQRKEWDVVGLVGQVITRQDGSLEVGGYAGCNNGIATNATRGFKVLRIIDNETALILVK